MAIMFAAFGIYALWKATAILSAAMAERAKRPRPVRLKATAPSPAHCPPTKAELVAQAKARLDERLQAIHRADLDEAERRAASEHARQQYLKELNGVL